MKLTRLRSYKSLMAALIFLAPFMILYVWFWIYPIFKGFISSFNSGIFGGQQKFVGLDNYSFMISDPKFWSSFGNTIYFIVISTPAIVVLGLILAILVNMKLKGTTILRTVYFMPFMLSVSVMGSIWMFILQSRTGLISEITRSLGMKEISFLGSWEMGWMSILIATIWWTVGFNMILFLAGLQEIPEDIYEASDIDGAGGWKKFWYITMPSLKGVTALVIILQSISLIHTVISEGQSNLW